MEHNQLTIKTYMAVMAERDAAVRERSMALEERKRAFAERDMAMLQRDAAIAERNVAISERNDAISALHFRESSMNDHNMTPPDSPGHGVRGEAKYIHHHQQMHHAPHFLEAAENPREIPANNPLHITVGSETPKQRRGKQAKETKANSAKKSSKSTGKGKKVPDSLNYQVTPATSNSWKTEQDFGSDGEDLDGQLETWKDDLGLNQIDFDDSAMPVPVCSCTGVPQPCYKWGNGGWQSACCTITMSMYPLPQSSNKKHSRVGGRKMSGNVFNKLLNRLASEGHDLYAPLDLKDHWSKHGTNRYSTQK